MNPTFCSAHSCKVSYWNGSDVVLLCATVGLLTWTGAGCKLRPLRFPLGNGGSPKSGNVSPIIDLPWGWFLIGYISLTKGCSANTSSLCVGIFGNALRPAASGSVSLSRLCCRAGHVHLALPHLYHRSWAAFSQVFVLQGMWFKRITPSFKIEFMFFRFHFFWFQSHFRPLNPRLVYSEPHVLLLKFKLNPILAREFTHVNHVCLVASPCFADQLPSCVGSPFLLLQCPCFLPKSC